MKDFIIQTVSKKGSYEFITRYDDMFKAMKKNFRHEGEEDDHKLPLVVSKQTGSKKTYVVMTFEDFDKIAKLSDHWDRSWKPKRELKDR